MADMRRFVAALKVAQKAKGWTNERLAREASIAVRTVYRVKHRESREPEKSIIQALARALGMDDYLVAVEPETTKPVQAA